MSAYVCDHDTIDLVASASAWALPDWSLGDAVKVAGAVRVPLVEIGQLRGAPMMAPATAIDLRDGATVGALLYAENVYSVCARYGDRFDPSELDAYRFRPVSIEDFPEAVRVPLVLKSIACLRYQSCEADDYAETAAARVLDAIERAVVAATWRDLPDLPWGYTRGWQPATPAATPARPRRAAAISA